jgi:hypothetical protein
MTLKILCTTPLSIATGLNAHALVHDSVEGATQLIFFSQGGGQDASKEI